MEILGIVVVVFLAWGLWQIFKNNETKSTPKRTERKERTSYRKSVEKPEIETQFVVVDIETTGLNPDKNSIIEIGAIKVDVRLSDHPTFSTLINPGKKISNKIISITGITNEMLSEASDISKEMPDFLSFIEELPLVLHNAPFDMAFLEIAAGKNGRKIRNLIIDTLPLSRKVFPNLPNHKLTTLIQHLGIKVERSHRALDDCFATLWIYRKCTL